MPSTKSPSFALHPQLAADTFVIGQLAGCEVLLMNDSQYPWMILVPMRPDIREVYELPAHEQAALWQLVSDLGQGMMAEFAGSKLNVGALGNMVPQLHVHVIVRHAHDATWPSPVWGKVAATPYLASQRDAMLERCRQLLRDLATR